MDDGLQNPSLLKDLAIAVVDGATGLGNRLPLPAGPLRAPLDAQWPKVDAVLVIGEGSAAEALAREAAGLAKPVLRGRLEPDPAAAARLAGRRVLAFAGIGRPDKFFETLKACGAFVEAERAFPDHHRFSADDLAALSQEAVSRGLVLVTTEKDAARIGTLAHRAENVRFSALNDAPLLEQSIGSIPKVASTVGSDAQDPTDTILILPVRLRLDDEAALRNLIKEALKRRRQSSVRG